ncbi:SufE family protein [Pedobacter steynii]
MNIKPIHEIEKEIIEDFALFDSWEDKYEYIIDMGKKLPVLDDAHKLDEKQNKRMPEYRLACSLL